MVQLLKEDLRRTPSIRSGEEQLLLCCTKLNGAASKDTISRWIKTVMLKAGIGTSLFKPNSTRSTVTSAANISIYEIMATAGWHSSFVFGKYYDKPVLSDGGFSHSVLTSNNC